jgi:hypothetical protein
VAVGLVRHTLKKKAASEIPEKNQKMNNEANKKESIRFIQP